MAERTQVTGKCPHLSGLAAPLATFERVCSQCHELADIEKNPPHTADEVAAVIKRMIDDNDMQAEKIELQQIEWYMTKKFAPAN